MPPAHWHRGRLSRLFSFLGRHEPESDAIPTQNSSVQHSPVQHLLETNVAPNPEERTKILEALSSARHRECALEQALANTPLGDESAREPIRARLTETQAFLNRHQALLSQFRTLPNELLALVFLACLPDVGSTPWTGLSWVQIGSFRLSQVCRKWRRIAITTPELWSVLPDIPLDHPKFPEFARSQAPMGLQWSLNMASYLKFMEEVLRRSREKDLYIHISVLPSSTRYSDASFRPPILEMLLKHEGRWAALGIDGNFDTVTAICDPGTDHLEEGSLHSVRFLRLRRLRLNLQTAHNSRVIGAFAEAPTLIDVTISACAPPDIQLPFHQLRNYRGNFTSGFMAPVCTLSSVLEQASALQELDIFTIGYSAWMHAMTHHGSILKNAVTLEHLRFLAIRLEEPRTWPVIRVLGELLDRLITPSLEELRVGGQRHKDGSPFLPVILRSIATGGRSSMRRLYLWRIHFTSDQLEKLLKATPLLEELNINLPAHVRISDLVKVALLGTISRQISAARARPRLKNLVLHVLKEDIENDETIAETLPEVVRESGCVLSRLRSRYNVQAHADIEDCLPGLRFIFSGMGETRCAQKILNFWVGDGNTEIDRSIGVLYRRLEDILFLLEDAHFNESRNRWTESFLGLFASELNSVMNDVEALELDKNEQVSQLFRSQLHSSLLRLSAVERGRTVDGLTYDFRERADRILKTWEPAIIENLKSNKIRWAIKGPRSLVYLPEDDEFHNSPSVDAIYRGLPDPQFEDVVWSKLS